MAERSVLCWFCANPTQPLNRVITTLKPFEELFTHRQMRLIANALNYVDNDPAGLGGHQALLLVSHLFTLVSLMKPSFDEAELANLVDMFYDCRLPG